MIFFLLGIDDAVEDGPSLGVMGGSTFGVNVGTNAGNGNGVMEVVNVDTDEESMFWEECWHICSVCRWLLRWIY